MDTGLRDSLYEQLLNYQPFNEQEAADLPVILSYIQTFPNIYERENVFAHMTSSPWIMNETRDKVLLVHHHIYRSWGWAGGHCDGERDTLAVAIQEGKEETGLTQLLPLDQKVFAIDVLPVPRHQKNGRFVSAHIHINITYACIAKESDAIQCKPDENSGVAWVELDKIEELVSEEDMKPVYAKLVEKMNIR